MERDEILNRAAAMRFLSDEERNACIAAGAPVVVDGRVRFRVRVKLNTEDDCA